MFQTLYPASQSKAVYDILCENPRPQESRRNESQAPEFKVLKDQENNVDNVSP